MSPARRYALGTVLLTAAFHATALGQTAYRATYVATAVEGPAPSIDGMLDEPLWTGALWDNRFHTTGDASPSQETLFAMVYDHRYLYLAISMNDEDPTAITKVPGKRDDTGGDRISTFFDTDLDGETSYAFAVNAAGVMHDQRGSDNGQTWDSDWNAEWQAAVTIDEWGWHVELRIPLAELGINGLEGQTWGMQFTRVVERLQEVSTWQPVSEDRGWTGSYGRLVFR